MENDLTNRIDFGIDFFSKAAGFRKEETIEIDFNQVDNYELDGVDSYESLL